MAEDNTLTPLETFLLGRLAQRELDGRSDAVLQSARDKLDRVLQEAQRRDPAVTQQIRDQQGLMTAGPERCPACQGSRALRGLVTGAYPGFPVTCMNAFHGETL